ncbi:hypothetical protein BC829DRAFT_414766 [Chytridium lagenaria]|nr:hypothetical protein BC829DRAFT_414766 [Chytridium lagenaria]
MNSDRLLNVSSTASPSKPSPLPPTPTNNVHLSSTFLTLPLSTPTRYHYRWLRHNCSCQIPHGCRHPQTGERIIDSVDVSTSVHPKTVQWTDKGLYVRWDDGHESVYGREWLEEFVYDRKTSGRRVDGVWGEGWRGRDGCCRSDWGDKYRRLVKDRMDRFGAVVVKGRGSDTEVIINDFLPQGKSVIPTHFGRIEDLRTDNTTNENTDQLGYTDAPVEVHTDQPFIAHPPGMQMLHSVTPAPNKGDGDSLLVDMKAVSEYLRVKPLLEVDGEGLLSKSNLLLAPFTTPSFDDIPAWYKAYDLLAHLVRDNASPFRNRFRLESGDLVLYDNHRMLHGRTGFSGFSMFVGCISRQMM